MYIIYALVFLLIAGLEATIARFQLMRPNNDFVSPQVFNRMFTNAWNNDDFLRRDASSICPSSSLFLF
jgi:hypothetical protein